VCVVTFKPGLNLDQILIFKSMRNLKHVCSVHITVHEVYVFLVHMIMIHSQPSL